ncbi:MAG TPA: amino acid ABC transporter substrate-binding protein [Azospirillum sp.]|nr:amino acid ABC transporter substrate-binding protein [Azospirillum sp.]
MTRHSVGAVCAFASAALVGLTSGALAQADGDTIVLGAAVSLTGAYSTLGKNTQDGYDFAVKRLNDMGGVNVGGKAYKLKVVYYDDESTPARGAQLAERLINQDGVKFLLGPYSSGLTKAIAPVTEKYKVPMVEANGADRGLFQSGYKYLFAVLSTSDQYLSPAVTLLAEMAKAQGKDPATTKIAVAVENDPFSQDVRDGVAEEAEKFGMKLVVDDRLPRDLNDMTATLTKVRAVKPDLLVVSGHAKGAVLVVKALSDSRVDVPAVATTHCDAAQIAEKTPKQSEYFLCGSQWDRTLSYKDKWFGTADDFAREFEAAYKYPASYQVAESAAGVLTFADAIARAGSLEPDKVRDALTKTDLMTFYGPIKFDEAGRNVAKSMVLYQVQDGQYKVVAPSKWASSKFIYPMPSWSQRE